ncbi:reverse transcriptase domain-containing protein [Candidatus Phytoplasma gossypii]|uniref:Reverse transcriptase domain-containing protein n=1 Tax=Candidatus Phytoplasma gossypii TaxID=2982629 RepID=A0ABT9D0B8_9MOLU|nr:reverse transcriptase domain-containing protein ['Gossypium sp.' phytoplasma]MDO8057135.1 reverse transcriptase domain-containing protein ['Gossypium sp.' phytoplasma]
MNIIEKGWQYKSTSDSPQGGIISPLLTNIFLDYLDKKLGKLVKAGKPQFKMNPKYIRATRLKLYKTRDKINHGLNLNLNLCVEYIRYADDFIIRAKGERDKAEGIKKLVRQWLTEDLGLKISKDKSKIVPATKGCQFLSYLVKINPTRNAIIKKKD